MIECEITLTDDIENIHKLFLPELPVRTNRAEYKIFKQKDALRIQVKAKDVTSMKAFVNSILKVLETHKKITKLKNGNG